jgi:hypothetical protein
MFAPTAPVPADVRAQADAFDWQSLAWLMEIPREHRDAFIWWLLTDIETEWRHHAEPSASASAPSAEVDAEIARAGRAFIRALEQRDYLVDREQIKAVGRFLQHQVKAPPLGRRKSTSRFERFVEYLLYVVYALGGKASCNRKSGTGTIIELLDDVRPMMPPGFIPKGLALHTIDRLRTEARKFGRGVESDQEFARMARLVIGCRPRMPTEDEIEMSVDGITYHSRH